MWALGTTGKGKHGVNVGATPSGVRSFKGIVDFGSKLSVSLSEGEQEISAVVLPRQRVAAKT